MSSVSIYLESFIVILDLLAVRSQKAWPEDPQEHLVDFFGQYRDPMWDNMEDWKEEMENIRCEFPVLESKITDLEQQIATEKRKTWAYTLYKQADPDVTVSALISKIINVFLRTNLATKCSFKSFPTLQSLIST